jgi:UDP-N-acetylmuramyl tripeptide synthase
MVVPIEQIEDALEVPVPLSTQLIMSDSRRLTGPGLFWEKPGAVLELQITDFEQQVVVDQWAVEMKRILLAIGWEKEQTTFQIFTGGANVAVSAPLDCLYSAVSAAQTAWHFCASRLLEQTSGNFEAMCQQLRYVIAQESNPPLLALMAAAGQNKIDILCDDDEISIGHGTGSHVWQRDDLPPPDLVNWAAFHDVPVALITGTNGKTTSVRLAATVAKQAGLVAGLTSTEFVRVGDTILDYGDYSGPGGARMLLRDKTLEMAFLEVARGGILRRGLPLRHAMGALITNVAADHLGQYGVNTVQELAVVKFAVHRTLTDEGVLVLNADDPLVVAEGNRTPVKLMWFSIAKSNPEVQSARHKGQACGWTENGWIVVFDGTSENLIVKIEDIPITMQGKAVYNIRNALGVACLCHVMNIDTLAIGDGLKFFKNDYRDNPGRCNEFKVKGGQLFVDFAHNPHSITAVTDALNNIRAKRRILMIGHAGDRSDDEIKGLTKGAFSLNPDVVIANENIDYLRGREVGDIPALIREECLEQGLAEDHFFYTENAVAGAQKAIELMQPGDVVLLLVISDRNKVFECIEQAMQTE